MSHPKERKGSPASVPMRLSEAALFVQLALRFGGVPMPSGPNCEKWQPPQDTPVSPMRPRHAIRKRRLDPVGGRGGRISKGGVREERVVGHLEFMELTNKVPVLQPVPPAFNFRDVPSSTP